MNYFYRCQQAQRFIWIDLGLIEILLINPLKLINLSTERLFSRKKSENQMKMFGKLIAMNTHHSARFVYSSSLVH